MSERQAASEIISTTEKAVGSITAGSVDVQREILRNINRTIRLLDVDTTGAIKPNSSNIKLIRTLRDDIHRLVVNPDYIKKVEKYLSTFGEIKGITDDVFTGLADGFKANRAIFGEVLKVNLNLTKDSLLGSGIDRNIIQPILDLVNKGITSGMNISDMEESLRVTIIGDHGRLGGLERYVTQISRDALNQYSRNYNQAISYNLGLEWYYYSGSIIQDTRSYCTERSNKYYHRKEVEQVPSQWAGMIPGTNSTSIFINAGGYNCRHIYMPVLINVVPKDVIERNISNGNYRPP
jgi:hypothetical protein